MRLLLFLLLVLTAAGCAGVDPHALKHYTRELCDPLVITIGERADIETVAVTQVKGIDPDLSQWFAQEIESELVSRKSFTVVERSNLDKVLEEHKLMLTDIFEDETRAKIGQLIGADALVVSEVQPSPDQSFFALRGRLIAMDSGEILTSASANVDADELIHLTKREGRGGFWAGLGNVLIAVLKVPASPVTMVFDIFETACVSERGVGSRVSHNYPERFLKGLWDGIPIPTPWVRGVFGNDLYLTGLMWRSWF